MNAHEPSLRRATEEDATQIAALAVQVFLDTYATDGVRPDLAREAFAQYSAAAFAARLREPARQFTLAERGAGLIGFSEVRLAALPAPDGATVGAEVARLYVQPRFQRAGIGRVLLRAAERDAASRGLDAVWLTVWEGNLPACRFYAALGYRHVGAATYTFEGNTYADLVVARHLRPGRSTLAARPARRPAGTRSSTMPASQDPTDAIRRKAAAFPGVAAGTSCNQSAFKAGKGTFLFIGPGAKGVGFKAMFKLGASMEQARKLAAERPDRFEVGTTGWVTARFTAAEPLPGRIWTRWLAESYDVTCGAGRTAQKPGRRGPSRR